MLNDFANFEEIVKFIILKTDLLGYKETIASANLFMVPTHRYLEIIR